MFLSDRFDGILSLITPFVFLPLHLEIIREHHLMLDTEQVYSSGGTSPWFPHLASFAVLPHLE